MHAIDLAPYGVMVLDGAGDSLENIRLQSTQAARCQLKMDCQRRFYVLFRPWPRLVTHDFCINMRA